MTTDVRTVVTSKLSAHIASPRLRESIEPSQCLRELELDSLALLETIYDLEEHFDITVDSMELQKLVTVSDLVTVINRSLGHAA